jgi:rhodanese-related sulfurtransferase
MRARCSGFTHSAALAAVLLARRGFADVHVVQGGMTAWLGSGWPVQDINPKPE